MYTDEAIARIEIKYPAVMEGLERLHVSCVTNSDTLPHDSRARDYLLFGAGRRVSVLRRSLSRIFELFPLRLERPLPFWKLTDVQVYLQAFVINLSGLFDNWAWAFVSFHHLEEDVGGQFGVGFQRKETQRFLPPGLRDYVMSEQSQRWNADYLKNYRDALAHKIPLYVPPARFTHEENERYWELEREKMAAIHERDFDRIEHTEAEQRELGRPMPAFLHSLGESQELTPILLHPQLIADALTVITFGDIFFENWKRRN